MNIEDCVSVRRANVGDLSELCRLFFQGAKFHADHAPYFFQIPSQAWAVEFFEGHLRNPEVFVWVAEIRGAVVGQARSEIRKSQKMELLRPTMTLQIEEVVVDETHRRRGIAKTLISSIEDHA